MSRRSDMARGADVGGACNPAQDDSLSRGRPQISRKGFLTALAVSGFGAGCVGAGAARGGSSERLAFRLGMTGFTYWKYDVDGMLRSMRLLGLHDLSVKDYHLGYDATEAACEAFRAKCAKQGVAPYAVGPIYMGSEAEVDRYFAYARRVGVKLVVGVPVDRLGKRRLSSRKVCEYVSKKCEETGIRYAIHNHGPSMPELFPTGRSAYEMVKDLSPKLGLCLDVGHEFRSGLDPAETVRACADRLFDVHLKDEDAPTDKGGCQVIGRGLIDWPEFIRALCEVRYSGVCALEFERDFDDNRHQIGECIGYFKCLMRLCGRVKFNGAETS